MGAASQTYREEEAELNQNTHHTPSHTAHLFLLLGSDLLCSYWFGANKHKLEDKAKVYCSGPFCSDNTRILVYMQLPLWSRAAEFGGIEGMSFSNIPGWLKLAAVTKYVYISSICSPISVSANTNPLPLYVWSKMLRCFTPIHSNCYLFPWTLSPVPTSLPRSPVRLLLGSAAVLIFTPVVIFAPGTRLLCARKHLEIV